jgi:hypothetical protein
MSNANANPNPNHDVPAPVQMLKLAMGYWVSQACAVAARLGIADRLAAGARASDELAREVGANPDALYRLLRCCASVGVFAEQADRRFVLTPVGETLRSGGPGSLRDFLIAETAPGHWLPWGRLHEAVIEGKPQTHATLGSDIFTFYAQNPDEAAPFNRAMANLSAIVAGEVAASFDFAAYGTVNDVGGGHGALLATVLEKFPRTRGVLFDLPHAIAEARPLFAAQGLAPRCELVAGDFFERVPAADVYLLKAILHDWDDASATRILKSCRAGAAPGAKMLIVEMIVPADGASSFAQLMDLNMLVMLTGRERTPAEYGALLEASGFRVDRLIPTHTPYGIIEATAV